MTQRQIAEMLGLSVATVSMAINDSPRVKPETKKKILQLASEKKYRVNELARCLSSGKTKSIGVLFPEFDNPFYAYLVDAIQRRLVDRGYIGFFISTNKESDMKQYIDLLVQRNVDGIISRQLRSEEMPLLELESVPTVFYSSRANNANQVGVDRARGICEAIKHLAGLGHRKIGFVGKQSDFEPRYQTYKNVIMGRDELIENPAWTTTGTSSYQCGYNGMKDLLKLKDRPTAIVCHCDIVALGALCAAFELGVKVPEQMSIVGFDNICESQFAAVPLTTIEVNINELAKNLVDVLFKRMETPDSPEPIKVIMEPKIVIRKSTAICN